MNRNELTTKLDNLRFDQASNIKFYKLLWSRLVEEGIKPADAEKIASVVQYDFSNIPEDNDSLSEFATSYAGFAIKVYNCITKLNGINNISPLLKYFDVGLLKIDTL